MTQAAVAMAPSTRLEYVDLDLEPPHAGEVMVELGATGVCHSDIGVFTGKLPSPMPVVLGHEGTGTIVAVGDGVEDLAPGDLVVTSWLAQCGECFYCRKGQPQLCEIAGVAFARNTLSDGTTRLSRNGQPVYQMAGLGTFARHCVIPQRSAVKIPSGIPQASAALLGCGVLTGWGAATNTADIVPGDSVAILGCGGVGLNAVQGARLAGASTIIAIDVHDERLELARLVGATHTLTPGETLVREVRQLSDGRGVDVALEASGRQDPITSAIRMTRRGGQIILIGSAGDDVMVSIPAFTGLVMTEKLIRGSLYGSSAVRRDVARLADLYARDELMLDELVTQTFAFEQANEAVDYCLSERGARAVIVF